MPRSGVCKLTPELIDRLEQVLAQAVIQEDVVSFLGIDRGTYRKWIRRGARATAKLLKGQKVPRSESIYLDLFNREKKALSAGKLSLLAIIRGAAKDGGQWTAAAWILERCFPQQFSLHGRRDLEDLKQLVKELKAERERGPA